MSSRNRLNLRGPRMFYFLVNDVTTFQPAISTAQPTGPVSSSSTTSSLPDTTTSTTTVGQSTTTLSSSTTQPTLPVVGQPNSKWTAMPVCFMINVGVAYHPRRSPHPNTSQVTNRCAAFNRQGRHPQEFVYPLNLFSIFMACCNVVILKVWAKISGNKCVIIIRFYVLLYFRGDLS